MSVARLSCTPAAVRHALALSVALSLGAAGSAHAQQTGAGAGQKASADSLHAAMSHAAGSAPAMSDSALRAFAMLHVAIAGVHDSADARLAESKNKTLAAQQDIRERMRKEIGAMIGKSGMSDSAYTQRLFVVSTDHETRTRFDKLVASITGQPTPGLAPVAAVADPVIAVPAGPAGVHIGHVVNAFSDTPGGVGLLPIALTEARTAAQHATLATRATSNLAMMQLHAGHVLNALDPTIVAAGPGKAYGVRKAALAVATHIELAAKADASNANVATHSVHIATAARSTAARADQIIVIAKQIQSATDAGAAAALVGQMASLCDQLLAGADVNADGRITWDNGEGGLQQVQQHVNLMLGTK